MILKIQNLPLRTPEMYMIAEYNVAEHQAAIIYTHRVQDPLHSFPHSRR